MVDRIDATRPIGYDKSDVATNFADEKKMKNINSLFTTNAAQQVAFAPQFGIGSLLNGSQQQSDAAAVQA